MLNGEISGAISLVNPQQPGGEDRLANDDDAGKRGFA